MGLCKAGGCSSSLCTGLGISGAKTCPTKHPASPLSANGRVRDICHQSKNIFCANCPRVWGEGAPLHHPLLMAWQMPIQLPARWDME